MKPKKISCDFCREKFKQEDLINTPIDEGDIAVLCESCKIKLEEDVDY